jgi:hypothetical protein
MNIKGLGSSKKAYKFHGIGVSMMTPLEKKNSTSKSLMLRNLKLGFESYYVLNFIWKWCAKDPKKKEYHLIFMDFRVKKFTIKNTPKIKTLMFEHYNFINLIEH